MAGDLVAQEIRIGLFLRGLLLVPDDDSYCLGPARADHFACGTGPDCARTENRAAGGGE